MEVLQMWHNISCSKSNDVKYYLDDRGIKINVRNYLENPPTKDELKELLEKLNISAFELVRASEKIYDQQNIIDIKDEDKLIEKMVENPILIQRPILIGSKKAFIVRAPKKVEDVINEF